MSVCLCVCVCVREAEETDLFSANVSGRKGVAVGETFHFHALHTPLKRTGE